MDTETTSPTTTPERTNVPPATFAIRVTDEQISVRQYRVTVSSPDGEWNTVETLALGDESRLSLEYANQWHRSKTDAGCTAGSSALNWTVSDTY
jgi:hypothetical protein